MANNINGRVYFTTNTDDLTKHKASYDRIVESIERTSQYEKK
jgi:hypothetical protein